jgi:hypothetical protein
MSIRINLGGRRANTAVLALALGVASLCGCGATDDAEWEGSEGIEPGQENAGSTQLAAKTRHCIGRVAVDGNSSLSFTLVGRGSAILANRARERASFRIAECFVAWARNAAADVVTSRCNGDGVRITYSTTDFSFDNAKTVTPGKNLKACTPKGNQARITYHGDTACGVGKLETGSGSPCGG